MMIQSINNLEISLPYTNKKDGRNGEKGQAQLI